MRIIYKKKSEKTKNRMDEIKANLESYQDSIVLLSGYAEGKLKLQGGDYSDRAAHFKRTQEDDLRYQWTLKNIKTQILLLEREFDTLCRYGA